MLIKEEKIKFKNLLVQSFYNCKDEDTILIAPPVACSVVKLKDVRGAREGRWATARKCFCLGRWPWTLLRIRQLFLLPCGAAQTLAYYNFVKCTFSEGCTDDWMKFSSHENEDDVFYMQVLVNQADNLFADVHCTSSTQQKVWSCLTIPQAVWEFCSITN
jgi:hypothetical protein